MGRTPARRARTSIVIARFGGGRSFGWRHAPTVLDWSAEA